MAQKNFERAKQITLKISEPLFEAIARQTENKQKWIKEVIEEKVFASGDKKYKAEVTEYYEKQSEEQKTKFLERAKNVKNTGAADTGKTKE